MINNMDKNQLMNNINKINQMLSDEEKQKILQSLNNQNKN